MGRTLDTNRKGAALIEYGLLVGLIAIVGIVSVSRLGQSVSGGFETAASSLDGSGATPADTGAGSNDTVITEDAPSTSTGAPQISSDGTATTNFEDGDTTDYYLVKLTETSDLNAVATDSDGRVVSQIAIYNASNTLLGFHWSTETNPVSQAGVQANDLPAGDYFVRVLAVNGAVGDYTITTSTRPDIANTTAGATSISFGNPIVSDFVIGDYHDFFEVTLPATGDINVLVENLDNTMRKQIAIWNSSGTLLGSSWGDTAQATFSRTALPAGAYFIRLLRGGSDNGQYRITVTQ